MMLDYESRLRVIGSQIEALDLRDIALFEIAGGFILRATRSPLQEAEAFEFADEQFPNLVEAANLSRGSGDDRAYHPALLPTGYEDFLRAIGGELDRLKAKSISIMELETAFIVTGLEPTETTNGRLTFQRFERALGTDAIRAVLDEAFNRRSKNGFFSRRPRLKPLRV